MDNLTDYTDAVGNLGNTASGLLNALKGGSKPAAGAPAPAASKTNWGLIAGIGGAVLVVLILVVSLGGRK